ncbi:MAG: allantoinase [Candidatus Binataceae bacterium]
MAGRLKLVKGAADRGALIYGVRLFQPGQPVKIEDASVSLNDGTAARVTMHLIEGTRAQIRRQLIQSIDAFFELLEH